jgi:hydroxymethylpyrimidine/phosphomethylpyrimidine kinase
MKPERKQWPIALSIAGSDSGGGAGIQADLRTFHARKVHGTTAITALTSQNPAEVVTVHPVPVEHVKSQLEAVFAELRPHAAKTGMLFSAEIIGAVAEFFSELSPAVPLVVDPVMIATSGATLLQPRAIEFLKTRLIPLATVVTPNLPEAEALLGRKLGSPEECRQGARDLYKMCGSAVLLKGGHLPGPEALDFFYDGSEEQLLISPRSKGVHTHGTGCTFSAVIAAELAKGATLSKAILTAKKFISTAVAESYRIRRHTSLKF